ELARGMTLARPDRFRPTRRVEVSVSVLKGARPLRERARVHFHAYTAETIAEVVLYGGKELRPGAQAFAQLRLAENLLLLPGDRFILRQFSPVVTIGGGAVLDVAPATRTRSEQARAEEYLQALATAVPADALAARILRHGASGLSLADAVAVTGWRPQQIEAAAAALVADQRVVRVGEILMAATAFAAAQSAVLDAVAAFHRGNPLVVGIGKEELREKAALGPAVFAGVLEALVRAGKLDLAGEQVRAAGRGVEMKDEEAEAKKTIEQAFARAGLKVPALKDVLASLALDRARAQKIVTLLLREKILVKLSDDLVFHREALDGLRLAVGDYKKKSAKIDVAGFKDLAGVSRKYAIPLLEYLDRERVTRRVGDERVIL
ncbi:MAG: SelB C-terminal domain-containing protein, partial [Terriglobales bacterium]